MTETADRLHYESKDTDEVKAAPATEEELAFNHLGERHLRHQGMGDECLARGDGAGQDVDHTGWEPGLFDEVREQLG
ncbi:MULTISPECIES: hypothetical protein [unclassified Streptomyces]|uniref:hypothetical protein n=1 Tax=unclassified Streptomyces TaxID=2593676 RepID=UPI0022566F07|nr:MULTISPECIES: hypothetical protein [unclassified Streptomyces]MCX5328385.1 hypothetical protein [Streptomyces sp. NBC_00140]MCX5357801.1 hypothetical protein [Streptomyces sp. NBC_00124]